MSVSPPAAATRPFLAPHLAARLASLPPPVVVFNKSHSGSRVLARLLRGQGIFIGAVLNESEDALPFLPLVEHAVLTYHPDFTPLWRGAAWPDALQRLIETALDQHLAGHRPGAPWGWKLCETTYILPLLAALFPTAHFVHLLRDGRDVAFADHVAPEQPFWRKIYFGSAAVQSWRGLALDHAAYRRASHLYNARHWREMVGLGRAYGAMLGPRYHEIRYEALCADPQGEAARLLGFLGRPLDAAALAAFAATLRPLSIGKHRARPLAMQAEVQQIIEPLLLACGYACIPQPPRPIRRHPAARLVGLLRHLGRRPFGAGRAKPGR